MQTLPYKCYASHKLKGARNDVEDTRKRPHEAEDIRKKDATIRGHGLEQIAETRIREDEVEDIWKRRHGVDAYSETRAREHDDNNIWKRRYEAEFIWKRVRRSKVSGNEDMGTQGRTDDPKTREREYKGPFIYYH